MGNCTLGANPQFIGIIQNNLGANSTTYVQTAGTITVNLDGTYSPTVGDFVCVSGTGAAQAKTTGTTPCSGYNTHVGFAAVTAASVSTISVFLTR